MCGTLPCLLWLHRQLCQMQWWAHFWMGAVVLLLQWISWLPWRKISRTGLWLLTVCFIVDNFSYSGNVINWIPDFALFWHHNLAWYHLKLAVSLDTWNSQYVVCWVDNQHHISVSYFATLYSCKCFKYPSKLSKISFEIIYTIKRAAAVSAKIWNCDIYTT